LFFFTCFFATGAAVPVAGAAVCAANVSPAVAKVRESPSNTEVIFFIVFIRSFFEALFVLFASISIDGASINPR
jgi:hypothetical protein